MNKLELSGRLFSCYLIALGMGLALLPQLLLPIFHLPMGDDLWVRLCGVLICNIGLFLWVAAKYQLLSIYWASVVTRCLVFASISLFVFWGMANLWLWLFGALDLVGAAITYQFLRSNPSRTAATHA